MQQGRSMVAFLGPEIRRVDTRFFFVQFSFQETCEARLVGAMSLGQQTKNKQKPINTHTHNWTFWVSPTKRVDGAVWFFLAPSFFGRLQLYGQRFFPQLGFTIPVDGRWVRREGASCFVDVADCALNRCFSKMTAKGGDLGLCFFFFGIIVEEAIVL